ncbi:MAG: hypothetical protein MI919_01325, partial [Holophagales bacterium]|nr:hypothetical protein [Holophagales bacterium]
MPELSPGFDFEEMRTLLTIAQQTYTGIPPTPGAPSVPDPPTNWKLDTELTPTGETILDNFWQVWRDESCKDRYAIAVRGTVDTSPSIFEDIFLPLIRARISFSLYDCDIPLTLDLNLAQKEGDSAVVAAVHAGFTLGLLSILFTTDKPLWVTLFELPDDAEVYITGHSQGASVALLLTSFVRHSSWFSSKSYKTYVFAPAKPGNDHYAYDLDQIAGVPGMAFSAVSTQDWVPQAPLTLQGLRAVNTPNPIVPFSGMPEAALAATPMLQTASTAVQGGMEEASQNLAKLLARLAAELATEEFRVPASQLTADPEALAGASSQVVGSDCFRSILEQLKDLVQPSLNFAKAAPLVPAFATPGANPEKPDDFFWQHHLGNYL